MRRERLSVVVALNLDVSIDCVYANVNNTDFVKEWQLESFVPEFSIMTVYFFFERKTFDL